MYKCPKSGLIVYETVDDFRDQTITLAFEDAQNYYFRVASHDFYDNRIWIVNKSTKAVSDMYFTDWMCDVMDSTTPMEVGVLKRAL